MASARIGARALRDLLGDWRNEAPAYEGLADRVTLLLLDGRISSGSRLPAERELAAALELSRTTVAAAYRRLREAGYASSLQGSGTTTALPHGRSEEPAPGDAPISFTHASLPATRLLTGVLDDGLIDEYRSHFGSLGYDGVGQPGLRAAVADWYGRRGLPTDPEQIVITTGSQNAIHLAARALIARGDRVWAESPSYPNAFDSLRDVGARLITTPVTVDDGWDLDTLEATFRRSAPTVAYVIPDFQNPTGRSMSVRDRERFLEAAAGAGTTVLADEATAELDIDRGIRHPPLGALAGRHGADVVHIGSASKSVWGGLRIGWVRAEPQLARRIAAGRGATDLGVPIFEQLVAARLLPKSDEVAEERRAQLREGREVARSAIEELLPDWTFPARLDGGLAAWVNLGAPVSSQLALAARARGLLIAAGPRFGVDGAFERYARIPIAADPVALRRGIELIAEIWPSVRRVTRGELDYAGTVA
ncbi:PLP-dependent aminotransferase family protein [Gryllotalpicola reticulitermitis]|uniref:PLP-dependent aminotransferase family protein n=1 Tax=Gryllotalpicola reticulitermitis TaxID=1184153 RepID=A0ABV8Q172_9MICO